MTEQINTVKIGNLIKKLRISKKLTQEDLARILNVSKVSVCKWENGEGASTESLFDICNYFGVEIDQLLEGKIKEKNYKKLRDDFLISFSPYQHHTEEEYICYLTYLKDAVEEFFENLATYCNGFMTEKDQEQLVNFAHILFTIEPHLYIGTGKSDVFNEAELIFERCGSKDTDEFRYEISQSLRLLDDSIKNFVMKSDNDVLIDALIDVLSVYERNELLTAIFEAKIKNYDELSSNKLMCKLLESGAMFLYPESAYNRTQVDEETIPIFHDCIEISEKSNAYKLMHPTSADSLLYGYLVWKVTDFSKYNELIDESLTKQMKEIIANGLSAYDVSLF